jgi:hypothetical protein
MNEKLNSILKMAGEVGGKYAKNLKDMDAQEMHAKASKAIKTASDVSNKYARAFTGMDAPTLLNKYGKHVGGGLLGLAAVSLLAYALQPTDQTQAASSQSGSESSQSSGEAQGGPIDPRIVGRWLYTWAKGDPISGLSLAVDDWLILNQDGTCQFGSSRAAGGTASIGMQTDQNELSSGTWRAENKTLYINGGDGQWVCVGSYLCDDAHLMIKAGGNKVYTRQ